jgi:HAD superfamily hydrolase (TIGR01509 family)
MQYFNLLSIDTKKPNSTDNKGWNSYFASFYHKHNDGIPAASTSQKKVIIFDVDGVLTDTSYLKAASVIGYSNILNFMATGTIPSQKHLMKALQDCPAISTDMVYRKGQQLPAIMIDYKTGKISYAQGRKVMLNHIEQSNKSEIEKNYLKSLCTMMTTPEILIETKVVVPGAIELLTELKSKGYKLYILSNGERSSLELSQKKFPEIFDQFDGSMVASDEKVLKPNPQSFFKFLEKFKIQPSQAVFIDDTQENIQAAQKLGIASIFFTSESELKDRLQKIL